MAHPHLVSAGDRQVFLFLQLCEGLQLRRCLLHLVDTQQTSTHLTTGARGPATGLELEDWYWSTARGPATGLELEDLLLV